MWYQIGLTTIACRYWCIIVRFCRLPKMKIGQERNVNSYRNVSTRIIKWSCRISMFSIPNPVKVSEYCYSHLSWTVWRIWTLMSGFRALIRVISTIILIGIECNLLISGLIGAMWYQTGLTTIACRYCYIIIQFSCLLKM